MMNGDSIREDAESISREPVLRARRTPPDQKMVDGIRLLERSIDLMRDGIRHQFPNADPPQVEVIAATVGHRQKASGMESLSPMHGA